MPLRLMMLLLQVLRTAVSHSHVCQAAPFAFCADMPAHAHQVSFSVLLALRSGWLPHVHVWQLPG